MAEETDLNLVKIFVDIKFNGEIVDSRVLECERSFQKLTDHAYSILSKKGVDFAKGTMFADFSRLIKEFDRFADMDGPEEIQNMDQVLVKMTVKHQESPETSIIENQLEDSNYVNVEDDEEINDKNVNDDSNFMSTIPPSCTSTPRRKCSLSDHGYTLQTIKDQREHRYLYTDDKAFPIDAVISEYEQSDQLRQAFTIENYNNRQISFEPAKRKMIDAAAKWLLRYSKRAGRLTPSVEDKTRMAFSIWLQFPWYGSGYNSTNPDDKAKLPFLKIFHPIQYGGSLQWRLSRMCYQRKVNDSKSPDEGSKSKRRCLETSLTPEEIEMALRDLQREASDSPTAIKAMQLLLEYRRHEIADNLDITPEKILAKYPSFLRVPHLIIDDFKYTMGHSNKEFVNYVELWMQTVPFIISEAQSKVRPHAVQKTIMESFTENGMRTLDSLLPDEKTQLAFLMLPCLLAPSVHSTKRRKGGNKEDAGTVDKIPLSKSIDHFVQFRSLGNGLSLKEVINECKQDKDLTQPFLLAITPTGKCGEDPSQLFLVINFRNVEIPERSFSHAVVFLFASFHTFNIAYPVELNSVYGFLEKLFGIPLSVNNTSRLSELYDRMISQSKL